MKKIYLGKDKSVIASQNALALYGSNLIAYFPWSIIFFGFN